MDREESLLVFPPGKTAQLQNVRRDFGVSGSGNRQGVEQERPADQHQFLVRTDYPGSSGSITGFDCLQPDALVRRFHLAPDLGPQGVDPAVRGDEQQHPRPGLVQQLEVTVGLAEQQAGPELRFDEQPLRAVSVIAGHVGAGTVLVCNLGSDRRDGFHTKILVPQQAVQRTEAGRRSVQDERQGVRCRVLDPAGQLRYQISQQSVGHQDSLHLRARRGALGRAGAGARGMAVLSGSLWYFCRRKESA